MLYLERLKVCLTITTCMQSNICMYVSIEVLCVCVQINKNFKKNNKEKSKQ